MANRYWVGGTATWDGTAGTKWAATSGGTGGETIPTSSDDVFFDANSGTGTVSLGSTAVGNNINFTGFAGTLNFSQVLTVYGNLTFSAGMTVTGSSGLSTFGGGTQVLTTNGKTIPGFIDKQNSGTISLGDALTCSSYIQLQNGTFTTNNFNVSASSFVQINGGVIFNLGSSTITLTSSLPLNFSSVSAVTFNAGTSTIICTNSSPEFGPKGNNSDYYSQGLSFYNVSFTNNSTSTVFINMRNTFNSVVFSGPSATGQRIYALRADQVIGSLQFSHPTSDKNKRILIYAESATTGQLSSSIRTSSSASTLTQVDFRNIAIVGGTLSGSDVGNLGNCQGITFTAPKTLYWNLPAGGNWTDNAWATSSGGTASLNNFPLPQDTVIIENTGLNTSSTITVTSAYRYLPTVDMSTRTNAMTLSITATAAAVYGDWKNGSGTTTTGNSIVFSGYKKQTITSNGRSFSNSINIQNTAGGSVELADALTTTSSFGVEYGSFDTKNFNLNIQKFDAAGTFGGRAIINLGSSTVNLTGSGSGAINFTNPGLVLNAGTSQINITFSSGATSIIVSPSCSFNNLTLTLASNNTCTFSLGNVSFANVTLNPPSVNGFTGISFTSNTVTITGTLTANGASPTRRCLLTSNSQQDTPRTITVGTLSATDCDFNGITLAGTAAGTAPTRAGNGGRNSGITFPAPKTVYWNLAGTQTWDANGWAATSGGTPAVNNYPLPQDIAVFDNTGAAGTVSSFTGLIFLPSINAGSRTSAMTLTIDSDSYITGNITLGSGVTIGGVTTNTLYFTKDGTQTFTSNGVTFNKNVRVYSTNTNLVLNDALNCRDLTLSYGSFDAVTYNVTCRVCVLSTTSSSIKMGSGTWTLTGTGAVWSMGPCPDFDPGTANIVLSDNTTTSRTFSSNGFGYNKLTIGGNTSTSTTTITGTGAFFTELASTKTVAHTLNFSSATNIYLGKWSITGTAGNVVTVSGTCSIALYGSATSGIDYLALGANITSSKVLSAAEFYAGPNSTGTAAGALFLTAPPTPRTLYWVGGAGNWSDTTKWSTTSGGAGGNAPPTSLDDVIFNSTSSAGSYTTTIDVDIFCKGLNVAGPATGTVTIELNGRNLTCNGNLFFAASGVAFTNNAGNLNFGGSTSGLTITTNGVSVANNPVAFKGHGSVWTLNSAFTANAGVVYSFLAGTFNSNGFSLNGSGFNADNSGLKTINLSSSTIDLNGGAGNYDIGFGSTKSVSNRLTFNAGTSTINLTSAFGATSYGGWKTFYNVAHTNVGSSNRSAQVYGDNIYNNYSMNSNSSGTWALQLYGNLTINGTFSRPNSFGSGRLSIESGFRNVKRTISCASANLVDVDFEDIIFTGAASPLTGTRLGDAGGNTGITFPAPKTVYMVNNNGSDIVTNVWSTTSGGAVSTDNFPLPQDTIVIDNNSGTGGANFGFQLRLGTINCSARTNSYSLTVNISQDMLGNIILSPAITLAGTPSFVFTGRALQTITSSGVAFPNLIEVDSLGGTVRLLDNFTCTRNNGSALTIKAGIFDANNFNADFSAGGVLFTASGGGAVYTRGLAMGNGTWTFGNGTPTSFSTSSGVVITGSADIRITSSVNSKTFATGGISFANNRIVNASVNALTISGGGTLGGIDAGPHDITLGSSTYKLQSFSAQGSIPRQLIAGSATSTPATLIFGSSGVILNTNNARIWGIAIYPDTNAFYVGATSDLTNSSGALLSSPAAAAGTSGFFFLPMR